MRSPDFPDEKPETTLRILMLGDSTLYGGSYIDRGDTYGSLLGKLLNEHSSDGRRVEILNVGVNGWGPFHKIGYVERFGSFDSDIVIICLPYGDILRPLYGLGEIPYFPEQHHLVSRLRKCFSRSSGDTERGK